MQPKPATCILPPGDPTSPLSRSRELSLRHAFLSFQKSILDLLLDDQTEYFAFTSIFSMSMRKIKKSARVIRGKWLPRVNGGGAREKWTHSLRSNCEKKMVDMCQARLFFHCLLNAQTLLFWSQDTTEKVLGSVLAQLFASIVANLLIPFRSGFVLFRCGGTSRQKGQGG